MKRLYMVDPFLSPRTTKLLDNTATSTFNNAHPCTLVLELPRAKWEVSELRVDFSERSLGPDVWAQLLSVFLRNSGLLPGNP